MVGKSVSLFGHQCHKRTLASSRVAKPLPLSPCKSVGLKRKAENVAGGLQVGTTVWDSPPTDLLLLTGLASSVFILSELLKLSEKFFSRDRPTQTLPEAV